MPRLGGMLRDWRRQEINLLFAQNIIHIILLSRVKKPAIGGLVVWPWGALVAALSRAAAHGVVLLCWRSSRACAEAMALSTGIHSASVNL